MSRASELLGKIYEERQARGGGPGAVLNFGSAQAAERAKGRLLKKYPHVASDPSTKVEVVPGGFQHPFRHVIKVTRGGRESYWPKGR